MSNNEPTLLDLLNDLSEHLNKAGDVLFQAIAKAEATPASAPVPEVVDEVFEDVTPPPVPAPEPTPEVKKKRGRPPKAAAPPPPVEVVKAEPEPPAVIEVPPSNPESGIKLPPPDEITPTYMRALSMRYIEAFGMNDLVALNLRYGGAAKLSAIDPKSYKTLAEEILGRLERSSSKKTEAPTPESDTPEPPPVQVIDWTEIKNKALEFQTANGPAALKALLTSFGAAKISALTKENATAFLEAIENAS